MAKTKSVKLFAFGAPKKMAAPALSGSPRKAAAPGDFGLVVGNDAGTLVTVNGTDAAGDIVDISTVATLAVTSSDESVATVTVSGMQYTIKTLKAGSVSFHSTATWNDGSAGPFSVDDPCEVATGPVTGLIVKHGNPTPA